MKTPTVFTLKKSIPFGKKVITLEIKLGPLFQGLVYLNKPRTPRSWNLASFTQSLMINTASFVQNLSENVPSQFPLWFITWIINSEDYSCVTLDLFITSLDSLIDCDDSVLISHLKSTCIVTSGFATELLRTLYQLACWRTFCSSPEGGTDCSRRREKRRH